MKTILLKLLNILDIRIFITASSIIGFLVGAFIFPSWQSAVEPAQILSGKVIYPIITPNSYSLTHLWTIINQFASLLFYLNFDEISISIILSGIAGSLSFLAISLLTFFLTRSKTISFLSPILLILQIGCSISGASYPVMLLGSFHTPGMIGFSFFMISLILIAFRNYKIGSFLLGCTPCVHLSLGTWAFYIVILTLITSREIAEYIKKSILWICAGLFASASSFILHQYQLKIHQLDIPSYPYQGETLQNVALFIKNWDFHRQAFFLSPGQIFSVGIPLLLSVYFLFRRINPAHRLFRMIIITVSSGYILSLAYYVPDIVPVKFLSLMPSRIINFSIFCFFPLAIAISYKLTRLQGSHLAYIPILCLSLATIFSSHKFSYIVLAVIVTIYFVLQNQQLKNRIKCSYENLRLINSIRALSFSMLFLITSGKLLFLFHHSHFKFEDRTNTLFFKRVSEGRGIILTASNIRAIQLRTRQPVLLNGENLDIFTYIHQPINFVEMLSREIYCTSFSIKQEPKIGSYQRNQGKLNWEQRTYSEWLELAKKI